MTLQESPHERSLPTWPRPDGAGSTSPLAGPEPAPFSVPDAIGPDAIGPEPGERSRRRRRWSLRIPRTLAAKLTAGMVALVICIVALIGASTYYALHRILGERLDQQLSDTTHSPGLEGLINGHGQRGDVAGPQSVWIAVLDPAGNIQPIPSSTQTKAMNLSVQQRQSLVRSDGKATSITTTDGEHLRVSAVANQYAIGPGQPVVVVIGLSEGELRDTLGNLIGIELGIGVAAVLLAAGLTAWGMSVGLGPLKRVTRTAQEVTAELSPDGAGLDRRVPETERHTEVGQLASSFNTMLDTVEREFTARRESEERMRQFLADASHELRTPLTSIRGYAELARMQRARRAPGAPDDSEDTLGRIESEGTRMSRLVEDLLILARADDTGTERPAAVREVIEADDLFQDAVAGVNAAHPDRVVARDVDPDLQLIGDRDQILRVLRNLITNAAVHTDPIGAIRLVGRREGDTVVLQVVDQGPGLEPAEAAHVFERFWRADKARTRVRGGSGLGMAIVAQIVAAHGGHVYFDSDVVRGSTVTVVLPDRLAGPAAGPPLGAR